MSILVIGSIGFDDIKTPFGKVKNVLGGSATYFAISASFFTDVNLVSVVGNDFNKKHFDIFKKFKINLDGLKQEKLKKTFHWSGEYTHNLNQANTIQTRLNVLEGFKPVIPHTYKNIKCIFLANIDPELQYEVILQIKSPKIIAIDTMNYWIERKRKQLLKVFKKSNIILINETEAKQLSKEINLVKAAKKIMSFGPKIVVIKRGEYGVIAFNNNEIFTAPAYPLKNVFDPTGAGDSFAGGFMGYLTKCNILNNANLRKAIIFGNVMGSFCVENFSLDRFKNLSWKDIVNRFIEFKKLTHFENIND